MPPISASQPSQLLFLPTFSCVELLDNNVEQNLVQNEVGGSTQNNTGSKTCCLTTMIICIVLLLAEIEPLIWVLTVKQGDSDQEQSFYWSAIIVLSVGAAVDSILLIMSICCYCKAKNTPDRNSSFVDIEANLENFDSNVTIQPEVEVDLNLGIPEVVIESPILEIDYDIE